MANKTLKISEEAAVQMPMKTVASLITMVAIGTWAYFGLHETLNSHSTQLELISKDLEQNTEFRIQDNMATCLRGKRVAERDYNPSVSYKCIKSKAETEIYMGQKSIRKIILD
jgi:hypothetical protein